MMTEKDIIIRSWSWNYGICQLKSYKMSQYDYECICIWMGELTLTYLSKCDYGGRV